MDIKCFTSSLTIYRQTALVNLFILQTIIDTNLVAATTLKKSLNYTHCTIHFKYMKFEISSLYLL